MEKECKKICNLHCVPDDKFIDGLIEVMDYTSNAKVKNKFICISEHEFTYKYIKKKERVKCITSSQLLSYIAHGEFNVIFLHSLYSIPLNAIITIPEEIKIVWLAWGYDLYCKPTMCSPFIKVSLYHKKTCKALKRTSCKEALYEGYRYGKYLFNRKRIQRIVNRIDYFSGVIPAEYHLMSRLPYFKAQEVVFNYFKLDAIISRKNLDTFSPIGRNILVGNSADPSNNHLDAFELLRHLNLEGKKIYVPLSYGGTADYRGRVKKEGEKYWGKNFIALETFLPYEEYCRIIASCGSVIMFHERQQALGNISVALWNGCSVFLSETSEVFKMYKAMGIPLFSLQSDLVDDNLQQVFSREEIMHTRERLLAFGAEEVLLGNIRKLYEKLQHDIFTSPSK